MAKRGVNDQCVMAWEIEGQLGKNRLVMGSTAIDPTTFVSAGSHRDLARYIMAAMRQYGLDLVRIGAGDWWSGNAQWDAWKLNPAAFNAMLDNWADAARAEGLQLIFTCLGFADGSYHRENEPLWNNASAEQQAANEFVGAVARHLKGRPEIYAVEWGNETDHDLIAEHYWLAKYPDYQARLDAYCAFVKHALETSTAIAGNGAPPIIMGHALIGAMFCVSKWHWEGAKFVVDGWDFTRNDRDFLKRPNDHQAIPSAHIYWFGAPIKDFLSDMPSAFARYCTARGVTGLVGEHGDLRTGAAWYVKEVEDGFAALGLDSCAMRLASINTAPQARTGFPLLYLPSPAPDIPPVTPVVPPSEDSSEPAQETPEEPAEPQDPPVEPPSEQEPIVDPPEDDKPAVEPPIAPGTIAIKEGDIKFTLRFGRYTAYLVEDRK